MSSFNPASVSFDPTARFKADFAINGSIGVMQLYIDVAIISPNGEKETESVVVYVIQVPAQHYQTLAIIINEPGVAVHVSALHFAVKKLLFMFAGPLSRTDEDLPFKFQMVGDDYDSTHLGFNNCLYIYAPYIDDDREALQNIFSDTDIRLKFRDMDFYEKEWQARRPDVFISHDSADKAAVAEPLYHALTARGLKVWLDKYALNLGDSLTDKINEGIAECRYGVLILSKAFLTNERWAKRELKSFSVKDAIEESNRLIPVWHDITEEDIKATGNYWLIDLLGGNTKSIEALADAIFKAVANS